jgi:hypothetical protein
MAKNLSNLPSDGTSFGQSTTDKISFYGVTPIVQRAGAVQATSLLSASSYVTVGSNTTAIVMEIANTLIAYGLWKGAA